MRISLQREAGAERPVYRQIAEQIRREIEAERLGAGARLPAIRDLAKTLQVHRDTVALAYEELASAGRRRVDRRTRHLRARRAASRTAAAPLDFQPELLADRRETARAGALAPALRKRGRSRAHALAGPRSLALSGRRLPPRAEPRADRRRRAALPIRRDAGAPAHARDDGGSPAQGRHRDRCRWHHPVSRREPGHLARAAPLRGDRRRDRRRGAHLQNVLSAATGLGLRTAPVPMREDGLDLAVARADAGAAGGEGALHAAHLPQPDRNHLLARASARAARDRARAAASR